MKGGARKKPGYDEGGCAGNRARVLSTTSRRSWKRGKRQKRGKKGQGRKKGREAARQSILYNGKTRWRDNGPSRSKGQRPKPGDAVAPPKTFGGNPI